VLRSSIREFLCSEAMAGLGVPTTRALCIIGADHPVRREAIETAAVVTRVAPGFVRFGSFEHWSSRGQGCSNCSNWPITSSTPSGPNAGPQLNPYDALLRDVSRRTGELMAHWMAVGFMHGVMNTDNMSILGLTLDYGPFGFMEAFDAGHICNHSDHQGRYTYRNQPHVGQWNLYRLADAFLPLIKSPEQARAAVDDTYGDAFATTFERLMLAKLGLRNGLPDDEDFIGKTFAFLQQHRPDFTTVLPHAVETAGGENRNNGRPYGQPGKSGKNRCPVPRPVYRPRCLRPWLARLACPAGANAVG
jgi:uncharacterized protein YdiU (UPF0061 family)